MITNAKLTLKSGRKVTLKSTVLLKFCNRSKTVTLVFNNTRMSSGFVKYVGNNKIAFMIDGTEEITALKIDGIVGWFYS